MTNIIKYGKIPNLIYVMSVGDIRTKEVNYQKLDRQQITINR